VTRLVWGLAILVVVVMIGLGALALVTFKTYSIPSVGMAPTLQTNDVILVNQTEHSSSPPRDDEIALFNPPIPTSKLFVKRVLGAPGESLRIHAGVVYRNSIALPEPYIAGTTDYDFEIKNHRILIDGSPLNSREANIPPSSEWTSPDTIPRGCYIMLGDNRNNSEDSHIFGCAQSGGVFSSGPEAGRPAGFMEHATAVVWPELRRRQLP